MRRHGLWAVLLSVLVASSANAENWAEKMFEVTRHDFGSVAKGAKTEFAFALKNIYTEDVHVAGVRTSCTCTRATVAKPWLKTYEAGAIVVEVNTPSFRGQKPATITVTFDKPSYAEVRLQSEVYIRSDVTIEPGIVALGTVDAGTEVLKSVSVTRSGRSGWKILEVKSSNPHLSGEVVKTEQNRGQVTCELSVRLDAGAPAGYVREPLLLITNDRQTQEVPVPVEGLVQPAISVSPAALFMGVVQPGEKVTRQLVVRGNKPFRITSVTCKGDCFEVGVEQASEPKTIHLVPVTFKAKQSPGKVIEQIHIETDLDEAAPQLSASAVISE